MWVNQAVTYVLLFCHMDGNYPSISNALTCTILHGVGKRRLHWYPTWSLILPSLFYTLQLLWLGGVIASYGGMYYPCHLILLHVGDWERRPPLTFPRLAQSDSGGGRDSDITSLSGCTSWFFNQTISLLFIYWDHRCGKHNQWSAIKLCIMTGKIPCIHYPGPESPCNFLPYRPDHLFAIGVFAISAWVTNKTISRIQAWCFHRIPRI